MNLSRPDRRERLDRLAAEFALGTSPPRVRRRLSSVAQRDRVVADALTEWERRLAVLATGCRRSRRRPASGHGSPPGSAST